MIDIEGKDGSKGKPFVRLQYSLCPVLNNYGRFPLYSGKIKPQTMAAVILALIGLIALLHFYFLYLEMFAWTTRAPKVFKTIPPEMFKPTKVLAANQGLYNGF